MSEDELFEQAKKRVELLKSYGTGAIEIKSGYGLTVDAELKMLRVIKRLKSACGIEIKATFLGAHAFPPKYKEDHRGYIDLIINEMIPAIAKENLADYIDVFCERNYFNVEEMAEILEAGIKIGLKPKVHVNQFSAMGGVRKAVESPGDAQRVLVGRPICTRYMDTRRPICLSMMAAGCPLRLSMAGSLPLFTKCSSSEDLQKSTTGLD